MRVFLRRAVDGWSSSGKFMNIRFLWRFRTCENSITVFRRRPVIERIYPADTGVSVMLCWLSFLQRGHEPLTCWRVVIRQEPCAMLGDLEQAGVALNPYRCDSEGAKGTYAATLTLSQHYLYGMHKHREKDYMPEIYWCMNHRRQK